MDVRLKQSEKGFTLVEISITIGIMGFLTLLTMTLLKNQSGQDAILKYRYEVNMKMIEAQRILNNPKRCEDVLKGLSVSAAGTEVPPEGLRYPEVNASTGLPTGNFLAPFLKVQKYSNYQVTSIKLKDGAIANSSIVVEVTFAPMADGLVSSFFRGSGSKLVESFRLVAVKDSVNRVSVCGPVVSESNNMAKKVFCDSLGTTVATWNNTTNECDLREFRCTPPSVPARMDRLGVWYCRDISERVNFDTIFDYTPATGCNKRFHFYLTAAGKIAIGCNVPAGARKGPRPLLP